MYQSPWTVQNNNWSFERQIHGPSTWNSPKRDTINQWHTVYSKVRPAARCFSFSWGGGLLLWLLSNLWAKITMWCVWSLGADWLRATGAVRSISTPHGRDASPSQVTPQQFVRFSQQFAGTHLERGTVRVKCLAREHNSMFPARARTQTARSGDERANHEATANARVNGEGSARVSIGWSEVPCFQCKLGQKVKFPRT